MLKVWFCTSRIPKIDFTDNLTFPHCEILIEVKIKWSKSYLVFRLIEKSCLWSAVCLQFNSEEFYKPLLNQVKVVLTNYYQFVHPCGYYYQSISIFKLYRNVLIITLPFQYIVCTTMFGYYYFTVKPRTMSISIKFTK